MSRVAGPVILGVQREFLNPDVAALRPEAVLFPGLDVLAGADLEVTAGEVFSNLQDNRRGAIAIPYQQVAYSNIPRGHQIVLQF